MRKFDYEKIYDFGNLYRAYLASRRSKRGTREVVQFELSVGPNICQLQEELKNVTFLPTRVTSSWRRYLA